MTVALRQYRVHEVAVLLGISVREVWRLVAAEKLAAPAKIGAAIGASPISSTHNKLRILPPCPAS